MNPPLFILAPPRSFTSLICAMIGQHPEMLGLPETNLFARSHYAELQKLYAVRRQSSHGLLRAIAELGLDGQNLENIRIAQQWLERNPDLSTSEIFRDLMAFAHPRRLVDKSPFHVSRMESLSRMYDAFPDAYFLHMTRHPRGNCESNYKFRKQIMEKVPKATQTGLLMPESDISPEKTWCIPHLLILEFLECVPENQQLRVRGEDIVLAPDDHLVYIAEWLGVSTSSDAIECMKHPEASPFACLGPPNARFGNDPGFLESPKFKPGRAHDLDLEGPLSWNQDLFLSDSVKELAKYLGYH